jgi:hypothetical protein
MAGITGQGTTYNLPNFVGELHGVSPEDTPLLSAIGGLTGGRSANGSTVFTWQTYDLRDADDSRQRTEGANAPQAEGRVRGNDYNVLEIHQEAAEVSYTKLAATNVVGTVAGGKSVLGAQPVQDELSWQVAQALKQVARDVEKGFITGQRTLPSDNSSPRKTGGLIEAIERGQVVNGTTKSNVVEVEFDSGSGTFAAALTEDDVLDLMQMVWDNGGLVEGETRTLITNSTLKRALTKLFIKDRNYQEVSRNVGGVNLQTIETDFGRVNIMLDRYMPADKLVVASLNELAPVYLEIPGKGHFFAEPLAKNGAAERVQLYGEIGLEFGAALHHGLIKFTDTAA